MGERGRKREKEGGEEGVCLHVIKVSDLALLVGDDGELDIAASNLANVLDPTLVASQGVGRKANQLGTTLGELGLKLGEGAELGGADRGVVLGVGEEDDPVVADELVEVDGASGGLGLEVRRDGAEAEGLRTGSHCDGGVVDDL